MTEEEKKTIERALNIVQYVSRNIPMHTNSYLIKKIEWWWDNEKVQQWAKDNSY